jgi:hypothetical protein
MNTPKTFIGVSLLLLLLSAVFGLLNTQKTHRLRTQATQVDLARNAAEQLRIRQEDDLKGREAAVADAKATLDEARTKAGNTEAELIKAQKDKSDLQAKVRGNEAEIAQLLTRIEQAEEKQQAIDADPSTASAADPEVQLNDAKKQLNATERENASLADEVKASPERSTQPEPEKKRRLPVGRDPGIRGTVLAVNQAYNFVVLNLGARQGVEPNTEMLVLRGGSFIGKIRISSVEPATAIGDIITSSLVRGVRVQPGDTVIYAGTNS